MRKKVDGWFEHGSGKQRGFKRGEVEVWLVFDRDAHEHFSDTLRLAEERGWKLAVGNPCLELWALLLFEDWRGEAGCHEIRKRLKGCFKQYSHRRPPRLPLERLRDLEQRLDLADRRAEALRKMGRGYENPPFTSFHLLVRRLRGVQ